MTCCTMHYLICRTDLQGSHLCDFETWKDWKGSPQEVKLKMRLEMEKGKANTQRYLDNAADIAEGIMKSGLLYDSHRQHLSHALNKRQGRLQNLDKSLAQQNAQLIQVASVICLGSTSSTLCYLLCYCCSYPSWYFLAHMSCIASKLCWCAANMVAEWSNNRVHLS